MVVGAASQSQARDRRNGRPQRFFGRFVMVDPRGEKFAFLMYYGFASGGAHTWLMCHSSANQKLPWKILQEPARRRVLGPPRSS